MSNIWAHVRRLEGTTLTTLSRGKSFKVECVRDDRIHIVPTGGNGTVRWFPRDVIELVANRGYPAAELRRRVQDERPGTHSASYAAAIIAAIAHKV